MSELMNRPRWLRELQRQARLSWAERGFPDRRREEEWRWTDLTPLKQKAFPIAECPGGVTREQLSRWCFGECHRLVLVDGFFQPECSDWPPGLELEELPRACRRDEVEALLGQVVDGEHGLIQLNTAHFQSGLYLRVQRPIERPLQLLCLQSKPETALPRSLIVLEKEVSLTLIETFVSLGEGLTSSVAEVVLQEGATLDHIKLQLEHDHHFHFGGLYVRQRSASRFRQFHFAHGSRIARTEIHVHLQGEAGVAQLTGLHLATGRRHLDSHTWIWHEASRCESRDRYKSIAAQRGRSAFQGRIVVQEGAVGSDAHMEHRGLLLSEQAEIDAKPQLEIYCDDVRCTHGVAIGRLDSEAIFYLQSRGISKKEAQWLLLEGFVNELLETVRVETVRGCLQQDFRKLLQQLPVE